MMRKILLSLPFLVVAYTSQSQQDPLYSQSFNNPMLINPAFAGNNERLYAGVAYRAQWAGIQGGPTTFNFNSHIALANNKVGVGVIALQDQLGDIKNTQYGTSFSYRIKLKNSTSFSFGMQTGFTRYATDPNAVKVLNYPDPAFNQFTETKFNTGAGFLLQNERFLLSLSVPRMLPSTISQGGQSIQVYSQTVYLYGAYSFYVNERVQFRPSVLLRAAQGTPVSADVNANFIFNKMYTAGVFARSFTTYGALVQVVMQNYRFGYVFEVPGKGSALNFNTHEISLALSLDVLSTHNHSSTGF
jgi:type IX secretion system PorP/SprF family membrane protein